jgi:hypothetical protein
VVGTAKDKLLAGTANNASFDAQPTTTPAVDRSMGSHFQEYGWVAAYAGVAVARARDTTCR